jgi:hypothetical protein
MMEKVLHRYPDYGILHKGDKDWSYPGDISYHGRFLARLFNDPQSPPITDFFTLLKGLTIRFSLFFSLTQDQRWIKDQEKWER